MLGSIYGLVSGNMDNPVSEYGQYVIDWYNERKSDALKAKERRRAEKIQKAGSEPAKAWEFLKETLSDPALATSFFIEQVPLLAMSGSAGLAARAGLAATGARAATQAATATGTAVATGAALQGAEAGGEAYERLIGIPTAEEQQRALQELKASGLAADLDNQDLWAANESYRSLVESGVSPDEARKAVALELSRWAAIKTAALSIGVQLALPGARSIERVITGGGVGMAKGGARGAATGALRSTFGEGFSEGLEEGYAQYAANVAVRAVDPSQDPFEGVGEATGSGLAFAPIGGVSGAIEGSRRADRDVSFDGEDSGAVPGGMIQSGQRAVWRTKGQEIPVEIINTNQRVPGDNRPYAHVRMGDNETLVPMDELSLAVQPEPSGPIGRSVRQAQQAAQVAQPERVVVRTPDGELTGTLESAAQDGVVRVLSDDGTIFEFTPQDPVEIVPAADEVVTEPVSVEAEPVVEAVEAEPAAEAVAEPVETIETEASSEGPTASVPSMITREMRRQLCDLGYTADDIRAMRPEQARQIIDAGERKTDQPEMVMRRDGTPFKSEQTARQAMKNRRLQGYEPVQVEGGWALVAQNRGESEQQASSPESLTAASGRAAPEITEDIAKAELEAASAELQRAQDTGTDAELAAANRRFSETLDRLRRQVTEQNERQGYVSVDPETLRDVTSWVIRNKETGEPVMQTYDRKKVEALNTEKYEAVPVEQHLAELNDPESKAGHAARQEQLDDTPADKFDPQGASPRASAEPASRKKDRKPAKTARKQKNSPRVQAFVDKRGLAKGATVTFNSDHDYATANTPYIIEDIRLNSMYIRDAESGSGTLIDLAYLAAEDKRNPIISSVIPPKRKTRKSGRVKSAQPVGAPRRETEKGRSEEGLVYRSDGSPFKTAQAARLAAKNRRLQGYEPVQVDGGWALRPVQASQEKEARRDGQPGTRDKEAPERNQLDDELRRAKERVKRLRREKGDDDAETKAAESQLRKMRQSIFQAEDLLDSAMAGDSGAIGRIEELGFSKTAASLRGAEERTQKGEESAQDGQPQIRSEKQQAGKEQRPQPTPNRLVTDERAEELRRRLKAKLSQLSSGIDPEILAIGTELAVYHIERGARRFAAFAKAVAQDLGTTIEKIRPYLRSWYNGARDMIEDMGGDVSGMDSPNQVREALARLDQGEETVASDRRNSEQRDIYNARLEDIKDLDEAKSILEQLRTELLIDERTGLGSNKAWLTRQPKRYVASIDLDSLKFVNDNMGHEAGDALIAAAGEALRTAGLSRDAYHVSGDEFYAQADDIETLRDALERARQYLAAATISGRGYAYTGAGFSYGIGENIHDAEIALTQDKQARERRGERAARGERPRGFVDTDQRRRGFGAGQSDDSQAATDRSGERPERPEPQLGQHADSGIPVTEVRVADLQLSTDVPQFKSGADERGVVEPLEGEFDRRGLAPIQVWRRLDGRLEVISGRHRLDLARRTGQETIPAQIYNEADGFDKAQAAILDAELNIRDGQGKVIDYVDFFREGYYTEEQARAKGLLARTPGRRGYRIANSGSDTLIAALRAGRIPTPKRKRSR